MFSGRVGSDIVVPEECLHLGVAWADAAISASRTTATTARKARSFYLAITRIRRTLVSSFISCSLAARLISGARAHVQRLSCGQDNLHAEASETGVRVGSRIVVGRVGGPNIFTNGIECVSLLLPAPRQVHLPSGADSESLKR